MIQIESISIKCLFIFIVSFSLNFSATTSEIYQYSIQPKNEIEDSCFISCQDRQETFHDVALLSSAASETENVNRITLDGYLIIQNDLYSPEEFCVTNRIDLSHVSVKVCKRYCHENDFKSLCIPKCCSWEESVKLDTNGENGKCTDFDGWMYKWRPTYYDTKQYRERTLTEEETENLRPHYYFNEYLGSQCTTVWIKEDSLLEFHLIQNGDIRWKYHRVNKWYKIPKESSNYCVDNDEKSGQLLLKICFEDLLNSVRRHTTLFSCMAFSSVLVLFWILLLNVLVWETQNVHGWIQFTFFLALFFFYLMEGLGLIIFPEDLQVRPGCYILSVAHHFFTTLTTTTLATVSWDIFWTFLKMSPSAEDHMNLRRLYLSVTASSGTAILVICVGVILNLTDSPGRTHYGFLFCIGTYWIVGLFLQGSFVVFSISMFISTAVVIFKHKADSKRSNDGRFYRDLAMVFVKLMVVQGLTWTSVMLINFLNYFQHRLRYDFCIRVIYNTQSLLFFFLFGCDQRKLKSLQDKYPRFKALSNALCSYSCRKNSKSDQDANNLLLPTR